MRTVSLGRALSPVATREAWGTEQNVEFGLAQDGTVHRTVSRQWKTQE